MHRARWAWPNWSPSSPLVCKLWDCLCSRRQGMDWKDTRNWNGIVKMNSWPNRKRNCSLVPGASRVPPDPPTLSTYPSASNNPDTTGLWLGSNPAASLDQGFGQTGRLGWSFCTGQRALGRLYFSVPMLRALGNVAGWRGAKQFISRKELHPGQEVRATVFIFTKEK